MPMSWQDKRRRRKPPTMRGNELNCSFNDEGVVHNATMRGGGGMSFLKRQRPWRTAVAFFLPALLFACTTCPAAAQSTGVAPWNTCFDAAARHYRLHPALLRAIARQESGMNPRAIGKNTNGTLDLGLMQINTSWLPKLARAGISRERLMDPCTNIIVGAWVLHDAVSRHGLSWKAVGVYHSPTPWRQRDYALKVARHLLREPGISLNAVADEPQAVQTAPRVETTAMEATS